jgi:hypothetical protein
MATQPNLPALLQAIQTALGPAIMPSLTAASAGSDIFEAYVLSIFLQAAGIEGAAIGFRNVNGPITNTFTFRTSPGHIWSESQPYTHAEIQFPNLPLLEAHTGVYVSGKSGLIHESDVLVLLSEEAQLARQNLVPPRSKRSILSAECKFYSAGLGIGLARGFVGLCSDLSSRECFFITNISGVSAEKLLTHQRKKWQTAVQPNQVVAVNRLRNAVQDVFKDFRAMYRL